MTIKNRIYNMIITVRGIIGSVRFKQFLVKCIFIYIMTIAFSTDSNAHMIDIYPILKWK